MRPSTIAVGIDLGTTYTVVAVIDQGRPKVIPNAEGQRLTPSVVAFAGDGKPLVGEPARRQAAANPQRTVFSIKRHMGSDYAVKIGDRCYMPTEISSCILRKVKLDAERYLGETIDKAVITVPAYFNDRQRQATKEAGIMAGLEVIRILSEPTAAALAYGLDREDIHTILVWDLGGGTFDVSILDLGEGIFEVKAVNGNTWLGGDDYDQRIMGYVAEQYREICGVDFHGDGATLQRLREVAEKAKIDLSSSMSISVAVPLNGEAVDSPLKFALTREKFCELTQDLLDNMIPPTRQALADAGLKPQDIDRMLLVGGATRMPAVQELARQLMGKEPYRGLDPDEVVALGAAVQAGMLMGVIDKVVLLDVLPLSLGIETQGGLFAPIIPRNTPLPTSASRLFTTAADYQTSVDIQVLQGERELAIDNISLGQFQLQGIPPLTRGIPRIEVTFGVDVDGIVHVSATDLLTENETKVKVVSSKGLSPRDIERMLAEAQSRAGEDEERRNRIVAGIQAANTIAAAEMVLESLSGSQGKAQAQRIRTAVLQVKRALAEGGAEEVIRQSSNLRELLEASHKAVPGGTKQRA